MAIETSLNAFAPSAPSARDSEVARETGKRLTSLLKSGKSSNKKAAPCLSLHVGGEEMALPTMAVGLLARLLTEIGEGHAVTLLPSDSELSTQGAAEILKVSRPFVVQLLDEGAIPSRKVGTHRRVLLRDLLEYKRRDDERRHALLDELTKQAQELNMGY